MLMFIAWSRYEDESSERQKLMLKDTRSDWGRGQGFLAVW